VGDELIMKKITAVLIGAGDRGTGYGKYAIESAHDIEFIAVAEPIEDRRKSFKKEHNIKEEMCFSGWKELLEQPRIADAVLICTQDRMHPNGGICKTK
jgi:predicted dehydrogenase